MYVIRLGTVWHIVDFSHLFGNRFLTSYVSIFFLQEVLVSTADEAKVHFVSVIPFTKHGPFQKYALVFVTYA